jgi:uncharacterized phage protein (TIGR02218 family)
MVLPLTAAITTALANDSVSLTLVATITRVDGTVFRFGNVQRSKVIGGNTYLPIEGLEIASIPSEINGGPTQIDLKVAAGLSGTVINRNEARDGLFDKADITISLIDFRTVASGAGTLFRGYIGEVKVSDRGLVIFQCVDILGRTKALPIQSRSPTCRNWFGDPLCGVDKEALGVATTATSWDGSMGLTVGSVGGNPDQFFWLGTVRVVSGPSEGREYAIRQQTGTSLLLYEPMEALDNGDSIIIFPGCDYTNGPLGCQRWSDCINQQADPFLIGMDARNVSYQEWDS